MPHHTPRISSGASGSRYRSLALDQRTTSISPYASTPSPTHCRRRASETAHTPMTAISPHPKTLTTAAIRRSETATLAGIQNAVPAQTPAAPSRSRSSGRPLDGMMSYRSRESLSVSTLRTTPGPSPSGDPGASLTSSTTTAPAGNVVDVDVATVAGAASAPSWRRPWRMPTNAPIVAAAVSTAAAHRRFARGTISPDNRIAPTTAHVSTPAHLTDTRAAHSSTSTATRHHPGRPSATWSASSTAHASSAQNSASLWSRIAEW